MLKISTEAVKEAAEVRPPSNSKAVRRDSAHWAKHNSSLCNTFAKGVKMKEYTYLHTSFVLVGKIFNQ